MSIKLINIKKNINGEKILSDINLNLEYGKIYGLTGPNGSGKTMIFNLICGFIKPTSGKILIDDLDISKKDIFPSSIGALIENPKFISSLSGYQNLSLLASIRKIATEDTIDNLLKQFKLIDQKNKKFSKYSLGMKQKLGIIQAIMEDPKIIILDEPFNGIDSESVRLIKNMLIKMKENGKLILLASHIQSDLEDLCDNIYYIEEGKVLN